jgi:hypothetical protein
MMRGLQKRLQKLESTLWDKLDDKDLSSYLGFMWFAVTYYLGNPRRGEKLIIAYARALGYANETELNYAVELDQRQLRQRGRLGVRQRDGSAQEELWKKFGISNTHTGGAEKRFEAFRRMEAGLPKSYKHKLQSILKRTDINLEWLRFRSGDFGAYLRCFA